MRINHFGISGGKDSTALLLWSIHESGYPKDSIRATFCDTGNEHPWTLEFVRFLSATVHPIEWLYPERDFYELAKHKGRFPSPTVRFCTVELKLEPSRDYVYRLLDEGYEVLLHSGVRADESRDRANLPEEEFDTWYALPVYRPLLRWTIEDVWAIHDRYGVPPNPLYGKGASRVGCWPCMMCKKREIKLVAELTPEKIAEIRIAELDGGTRECNTFFSPNKIPKRLRSRTVTTKDGRRVKIATIDDVVKWASTGYRGEESGSLFEDEPSSCSHSSGMCE